MIREILNDYAQTLNRKFEHNRSQTIGASEIGMCARRIHWQKFGTSNDEGYKNTLGTRGSIMESSFWYPALKKKFGTRLLYAGPDQKTFIDAPLSATPDGLLTRLDGRELTVFGIKDCGSEILLESKTIDPRVNLREAKKENEFQVQVQLGLVRKLTEHKPEYALISYIDASFWNEISEFVVKYDDDVFQYAKIRAAKILLPDELPQPEGYIAGEKECGYCPYAIRCGSVRRDVPVDSGQPVDKQFIAEITDMCVMLNGFQNVVQKSEAKVKEQQQAIKDRLREKNINNIPKVVRWSAIKARQSFNYPALKDAAEKAGVDLTQFETVGEPTDRLTVLI